MQPQQNPMHQRVEAIADAVVQKLSIGAQPRYTLLTAEQPGDNPNSLLENEESGDDYKILVSRSRGLDAFFCRVYDYYMKRGYRCIVVAHVLELSMLLFFNCVVTVLILFVDWSRLLACREHNGCDDITAFVFGHQPMQEWSIWNLFALLFVALIFLVLAWKTYMNLLDPHSNSVWGARDIQRFYVQKLQLNDDDVRILDWGAVLDRIVERQGGVTYRHHSAHDITNRIMRKENYLIALMHANMLPLKLGSLPFPTPVPQACIPVSCRDRIALPDFVSVPTPPEYFSLTLELSMKWFLLENMFTSDFRLDGHVRSLNAEKLQKDFKKVGLFIFFFSPFIMLGISMYLVLKHAETFYKDPRRVVERRWSRAARWQFRDFNELEHNFERRMRRSQAAAEKYVDHFPSELITIGARFLTFVGGSFASICLVICFINDSLMATHVYGHNLWWYLAICGSVLAVTRSLVGPTISPDSDPVLVFEEVRRLTHNLPESWRGDAARTRAVLDDVKQLFQPRATGVLQEMVGVLVTPIKLWTIYPRDALRILQFVRENTEHTEIIGDICGFATFNFEKYGENAYGASREMTIHSKRAAGNGKMEKSYANFLACHPRFNPTELTGIGALDRSYHDVHHQAASGQLPLSGIADGLSGQSLLGAEPLSVASGNGSAELHSSAASIEAGPGVEAGSISADQSMNASQNLMKISMQPTLSSSRYHHATALTASSHMQPLGWDGDLGRASHVGHGTSVETANCRLFDGRHDQMLAQLDRVAGLVAPLPQGASVGLRTMDEATQNSAATGLEPSVEHGWHDLEAAFNPVEMDGTKERS